jgi:hypothetical protein
MSAQPAPTPKPEPPVEEPKPTEPPVEEPPAPSVPAPAPPAEEPPSEEPPVDEPPVPTAPVEEPSRPEQTVAAEPALESIDGTVGREKAAVRDTAVGEAASIDDVVARLEESPAEIEEIATSASNGEDVPALEPGESTQPVGAPLQVELGLDPMLERKIFKKVFNRDRAAFDEAIGRLSQAETWRQASQILDEIFIRHDVDPYSRTALRFTDSVYTRFLPKSHN